MNILLTGSTGFVGTQLTLQLLGQGHSVYALARNKKKADNLRSSVPEHLQGRLYIVEGNIAEDMAGVTNEQIDQLQGCIDTVYHIAAYLSFDDREKDQLFHINVNGTRHILELAKKINVKNFFHVSTAYTLGDQLHATEELHSLDRPFVNYYEKSKCEAEHLVFEYKDDFHINIFRPSIIVGDSKTGEAESTFALYGVIRSFQLMKRRIERQKSVTRVKIRFVCNEDAAQNLVPVDYVVNVLVAGLEHAERNKIYHITNSHPPSNAFVFEVLKSELDFYGVELVPTKFEGELTDQELKFNEPMSVFQEYLKKTLHFDDSNTQELLSKSDLQPLDLNEQVLRTIISGKVNQ